MAWGTMSDMSALAELPKVNGQHRNGALATARKVRRSSYAWPAGPMTRSPSSWGYANRGTVYRIIAEALKAQTMEATDELRSLEKSRLDALQYALWDKAMDGDLKAARTVVRIVMARVRLLELHRVKAPAQ